MGMKVETSSHIKETTIFSFGHAILLRDFDTRPFMKLLTIVNMNDFYFMIKMSVRKSVELCET